MPTAEYCTSPRHGPSRRDYSEDGNIYTRDHIWCTKAHGQIARSTEVAYEHHDRWTIDLSLVDSRNYTNSWIP